MDNAELLEQLADIHLPPAISFWPPAPGWWILALLLVTLAIVGGMKILRAIRQRRICAYALNELDKAYGSYSAAVASEPVTANDAGLQFANELNSVLRRVALWHFPDATVASLSGASWVDFIRQKGESSDLTDEIAETISRGRFKTRCDADIDQLYQFGRRWITSLYMTPGTGSKSRK